MADECRVLFLHLASNSRLACPKLFLEQIYLVNKNI